MQPNELPYVYHVAYAHTYGFGTIVLRMARKMRTEEDVMACKEWIDSTAKVGSVGIINWKRLKGRKVKEVENENTGA